MAGVGDDLHVAVALLGPGVADGLVGLTEVGGIELVGLQLVLRLAEEGAVFLLRLVAVDDVLALVVLRGTGRGVLVALVDEPLGFLALLIIVAHRILIGIGHLLAGGRGLQSEHLQLAVYSHEGDIGPFLRGHEFLDLRLRHSHQAVALRRCQLPDVEIAHGVRRVFLPLQVRVIVGINLCYHTFVV